MHNVASYRPVSNLPHMSKILERIINCQLVSHLEELQLLPEVQSAYCRGHSTETAVLKVFSDLIDAISNGKFALLSLLDLSAAFDTVDHNILMLRLEMSFGFRSMPLEWLCSYLEGRSQSVSLNSHSTVPRTVTCGVPQGSVLGPLLFTLYAADIGKVIQQHRLSHHCYADDNQVYAACILSECTAMKSRRIHCIESIGAWMASNRLALNPLKSKFMWCASPRRTYLIDKSAFVLTDGSVNVSSSVRNLGVYFDESLSMTDHVNRLVRTCFYQRKLVHARPCQLTSAYVLLPTPSNQIYLTFSDRRSGNASC